MENGLCQICNSDKFKYSCPKCDISYCSLKCYRDEKHLNCSEKFYKQCIEEEIANQITSNKNSKEVCKMLEILQRVSNQNIVEENSFSDQGLADQGCLEELDSDDEEEEQSLSKRIENINIDDANELWNTLTKGEKLQFESLVHNGEITKFVPPFDPWWTKQIPRKIVKDIDDNEEQDLKNLNYPPISDNITDFDKIMKKKPNPLVKYSLNNILGAYTCVVRFFTGDHLSSTLEAANYLWMISSVLKKNSVFNSNEEALKSIIIEGQNETLGMDIKDYSLICKDVNNIINGPFEESNCDIYKMSALSDAKNIFIKAKYEKKNEKNETRSNFSKKFSNFLIDNELNKNKINQIVKKIDFFLSYVKSKVYLENI